MTVRSVCVELMNHAQGTVINATPLMEIQAQYASVEIQEMPAMVLQT